MKAAQHYKNLFGDRYWIELQHHFSPHHDRLVDDLVDLADALHLRCVVTNNVHYARREDHERRDVLVSIRHNQSLDDVERSLFANSEYYLKTEKQLAPLFQDYPLALRNTHRIAEQCQFTLDYRLQDLPQIETPDGVSAQDYLRQLCTDALPYESSEQMTTQLEHELAVIQHSGLSNYFLVVWDIVRFAREHRILCQGRGSAANSLVAYLLGISPINPLAHNLVFERFLSAERQVVPDIDIDFQADRREEVIQYLYNKYGHNHAAMACTFVTFRSRSAIRDVGKALGIPPLWIELAAKSTERYEIPDDIAGLALVAEDTWTRLLDMVKQINRFPRHLGIHNGGMVIMGSPLSERIPTEPATMEDRYVVQWDKDDLEDMGLVKIDILGLRMLSLLAEAAQITGVDLEQIPAEDPKVYDLICAADTVGLFQVESRAQVSVLPRLQPRKFGDLIVSISLIRPGPIQGDMVHPYLRRRLGEEPIKYAHPLLKDALEETLGVILFQEQVLKLARNLAGFTAGQGELLRRALGSKDAAIRLKTFHEAFINGALDKGVPLDTAENVFKQLEAFGSYSFPKSHAASFAVLVYRSAWLKVYHPLAFYTALLNHQPMGFWSPAVVLNDTKRHGIRVLPVDIRHSDYDCTVESGALRIGLRYVKG
ncbi:MAG: DNA polymerase III subunit alpha, partial [Chloroflexota bacterium]